MRMRRRRRRVTPLMIPRSSGEHRCASGSGDSGESTARGRLGGTKDQDPSWLHIGCGGVLLA